MSEKLTPIGTQLPAGWNLRKLGTITTKVGSGATPKGGSAVYKGDGVSFIRSQNVFDHRFSADGLVYIDDEQASKLAGVSVQPRDVLLNITGDGDTIARCCTAPIEYLPARVNQHVAIIRTSSGLIPEFLQRYLSHPAMREHMLNHNSGGSRRALTKALIESFDIVVPPVAAQRAIAQVLGALDDKIAVNERIAATADELRTSHFQQAIRESPADFTTQPLSATANFVNGRAFTKDATGTGRMVVRIAEINSGPGGSTVYNEIEVADQHLVRPGDVLFAWSGSLTAARWFRPEAIINQHIFKVLPQLDYPLWLAFELVQLKLVDFRNTAADKATTMGHIQRKHLDEPVPVPTGGRLKQLDATLGPLWDRALVAEQENLVLANLRDTLLPKLMSGQLTVKQAETLAEDVT